MGFGLTKRERLCQVKAIDRLVAEGRYCSSGCIRCRYIIRPIDKETAQQCPEIQPRINRFVVSVPKRHFKRAVKRNLLKRRIREAYRLQKDCLPSIGLDLLLVYRDSEIRDFQEISQAIHQIMEHILTTEIKGMTQEEKIQ